MSKTKLEEKTIKTVQQYAGTEVINVFMKKNGISYNRVQRNSKVMFNCRHKSFTNGVLKIVL
jgi:hypothetical protein